MNPDPARPAVLIANGPSANGYEPPAGAYVVGINDGFKRHRLDAVFSADCPQDLGPQWEALAGVYRVGIDYNPGYPTFDELLADMRPALRKYRTSVAPLLAWLAGKGFKSVEVVGLDALRGNGKPEARYTAEGHAAMLREFAGRFPGGLWVRFGNKRHRVQPGFEAKLGTVPAPAPDVALPASPPQGGMVENPDLVRLHPHHLRTAPDIECTIPQVLVEFDLTTACTRSCSFCAPPGSPTAERRKKRKRLPYKLHCRVIDELAAVGYNQPGRHLVYCGHGEPTLHPRLLDMLRYAKDKLPHATRIVYTNGDRMGVPLLNALGALGVTVLFDCYDDETGRAVRGAAAKSTIHPARVRCIDQVEKPLRYSSRCGTVAEAAPQRVAKQPCSAPGSRLFLTAAGKWLLCCEDYAWRTTWPGALSPGGLNERKDFQRLVTALAAGTPAAEPCKACDRRLGTVPDFQRYPMLHTIDRLRPAPVWPAAPKGYRRLVVVPCSANSMQLDQVPRARIVLDAIDRRSRMDGRTLLLWNDDKVKQCPAELRGDPAKRMVWEYGRALGWAGINLGLGEAYQYAVREGYDAVIKLDAADVAILRDGWDAWILDGMASYSMSGYDQVYYRDGWPKRELGQMPGTAQNELYAQDWARDWTTQGYQHDDYCQGGCYALGRAAIEHMDRIIGMPTEWEKDIGEDHAFSTRCKVLGIPLVSNPAIMSHFSRKWHYSLTCARYFRDRKGAAVIHPVRDVGVLKTLCEEGA